MAIAMCCVALALLAAPPREFRIDAGHSTVEFEIPFLYGHVRGRFDDVRGSVLIPESLHDGVGRSAAMAVIRTASINTGSAHRDDHLRSSDFFEAERFPQIVFRSGEVTGNAQAFTLAGSLTMHGVTRPIRIPCRVALPPTRDPHHIVVAVVTGATTIARRDFGIVGSDAHNPWFDKMRSATMGDSVRISLDIHLWAPDPDTPDSATQATMARIDAIGIDSAVARLRAAAARDSAAFSSAQPSLSNVGYAMIARGETRTGFLWLHALARLLRASADAMVGVGFANERMGDTTRARIWYRQAMTADSLNTRAYVRLESLARAAASP